MLRNSIKKLGGKRSNAQTHRIRKKSRKTRRFGGSPTPKNTTTLMSQIQKYMKNKLLKLYNDENKTELTNFEKNTIELEKLHDKPSMLYEGYENKPRPKKNRYGHLSEQSKQSKQSNNNKMPYKIRRVLGTPP